MAFRDRVRGQLRMIRPLLSPTPANQLEMAYIGTLLTGVTVGLMYLILLGYSTTTEFPAFFGDVGVAMAHAVPVIALLLLLHEFVGHYLVAELYKEDYTAYVLPTRVVKWNLMSIAALSVIFIIKVRGIFNIPGAVALLFGASPGGVLAMGKGKTPENDDEIAVAGPFVNFVVGVGAWWMMGQQLVLPHPSMGIGEAWLAGLGIWGLALAAWNAIPMGAMDGAKVVRNREFLTMGILALTFFGSVFILYKDLFGLL